MTPLHRIIEIRGVHAAYDTVEVLSGISLSVDARDRWAIIGPNGAGKSTLIKLIAGLTRSTRGTLLVNGTDINKYPARQRAQALAYVPQKPEGIIPYTVHDFVMLGRYAAMGILGLPSAADRRAVAEAIDICDVRALAMRLMNTLSGGECQRVLLAGAVAQSTPLLLLDEPTTFLDPAHERLFFEALSRLHTQRALTTIMITHDINSALFQCTHIAALRGGTFVFAGTTAEFRKRCPDILNAIFSIQFKRFLATEGQNEVYGAWGAS